MFKENLPEKDPYLENVGPKNQPIWAAHTRTFKMLCTSPQEANLAVQRGTAESLLKISYFMDIYSKHSVHCIFGTKLAKYFVIQVPVVKCLFLPVCDVDVVA